RFVPRALQLADEVLQHGSHDLLEAVRAGESPLLALVVDRLGFGVRRGRTLLVGLQEGTQLLQALASHEWSRYVAAGDDTVRRRSSGGIPSKRTDPGRADSRSGARL